MKRRALKAYGTTLPRGRSSAVLVGFQAGSRAAPTNKVRSKREHRHLLLPNWHGPFIGENSWTMIHYWHYWNSQMSWAGLPWRKQTLWAFLCWLLIAWHPCKWVDVRQKRVGGALEENFWTRWLIYVELQFIKNLNQNCCGARVDVQAGNQKNSINLRNWKQVKNQRKHRFPPFMSTIAVSDCNQVRSTSWNKKMSKSADRLNIPEAFYAGPAQQPAGTCGSTSFYHSVGQNLPVRSDLPHVELSKECTKYSKVKNPSTPWPSLQLASQLPINCSFPSTPLPSLTKSRTRQENLIFRPLKFWLVNTQPGYLLSILPSTTSVVSTRGTPGTGFQMFPRDSMSVPWKEGIRDGHLARHVAISLGSIQWVQWQRCKALRSVAKRCLEWISSFLWNHLTWGLWGLRGLGILAAEPRNHQAVCVTSMAQFLGSKNASPLQQTERSTMDERILNARIVPWRDGCTSWFRLFTSSRDQTPEWNTEWASSHAAWSRNLSSSERRK